MSDIYVLTVYNYYIIFIMSGRKWNNPSDINDLWDAWNEVKPRKKPPSSEDEETQERCQCKSVLSGHFDTPMLKTEGQFFARGPVLRFRCLNQRIVESPVLALLRTGPGGRHCMGYINNSRSRDMGAVGAVRVAGRQVVGHGAVRQKAGHVQVQRRRQNCHAS